MRNSFIKIVFSTAALLLGQWALAGGFDVEAPPLTTYKSKYVLVGVSGFKTIKESASENDIFSSRLAPSGEESGVWSNLPTDHKKIFKRVFITHYAGADQLAKVIDLVKQEDGTCDSDIGLVIMANSWGAWNANKLGQLYYQQCHRLPDLFVMIDGVTKPFIGTYTRSIWAYNCANYFQRDASLHGAPIANCLNQQIQTGRTGPIAGLIAVEWMGSDTGATLITQYFDEKLAPNWMKDQGVDYLKKLHEDPPPENQDF